MLLKCLQIAETAVFVEEGVLIIPAFFGSSTDQTALGNEFDINLYPLARILHLLIRFWDIFRVWQLLRHLSAFTQEAVQPRNGACVTPQPQLYPEYHQTGVWIPAAHILNEFNLIGPVLVWMPVRSVGAILQRLQGPIIPLAPAVDILPVGAVADCRFCHSVLLCIAN